MGGIEDGCTKKQRESAEVGDKILEYLKIYTIGIRNLTSEQIGDIYRTMGLIQGDILLNRHYIKEKENEMLYRFMSHIDKK